MIKWAGIVLLVAALAGVIFFSLPKKGPRVIWQKSLAAYWISAPAIGGDGAIHFGDIETNLCSVGPDGLVRWKTPLRNRPTATPPPTAGTGGRPATQYRFLQRAAIGPDRTIYLTTGVGELFAFSPEGQMRWSRDVGAPSGTLAAISAENIIYIGSTNSRLHALNADGSALWSFKASGDKTGNPVIGSDGTIYFGCSASNLYGLNRDGTLKWTCTNGARFFSHPIVGPDGTIYAECYPQFHAIRPDGTIQWSLTHLMSGQSAILNRSGTLFLCDSNGVLAVEASTGKVIWKHRVGDYGLVPSRGLALARDGTIYFVGDRVIDGLDSKGRLKWTFRRDPNPDPEAMGVWARTQDRLFNPRRRKQFYPGGFTLAEDGRLYAFMPDRIIYALEVPAGLDTNAPWPMFKHDVRHTGRANP